MTPMTKTEQLIQRWRGPSPADPYCGNNSTAITGGGQLSRLKAAGSAREARPCYSTMFCTWLTRGRARVVAGRPRLLGHECRLTKVNGRKTLIVSSRRQSRTNAFSFLH